MIMLINQMEGFRVMKNRRRWNEKNSNGVLMVVSALTLEPEKGKAEPAVPNIEAQMEKADKIESYRAKKTVHGIRTSITKY